MSSNGQFYLKYSLTGCLKVLIHFKFRFETGDSVHEQLRHAKGEGFRAGVTGLLKQVVSLEVEKVVI